MYASRTDAGGPFRLFVMNADGTDNRQLTEGGSDTADDLSPSWSPDGTRIAFSSSRPGGFPQIFVVAPDGSAMKRLTNGDQIDGNPSWSPDGTRIAFDRCCTAGSADIWTVNADGSGETDLTPGPDDETRSVLVAGRHPDRVRGLPRGWRQPRYLQRHLGWAHARAADHDTAIGLRAGLAAGSDLHGQRHVGTRSC